MRDQQRRRDRGLLKIERERGGRGVMEGERDCETERDTKRRDRIVHQADID